MSFFSVHNIVFDSKVSASAKLVYAYLSKCANKNSWSYPSHKRIADSCGISVTAVKKSISELQFEKLIEVHGQTRDDGGRRSNISTIIMPENKVYFTANPSIFSAKLTMKAKIVFLYFCRLAGKENTVYPAHKTTAKACGLSYATVRNAVDELETEEFIQREAQFRENKGQRSNLYILIDKSERQDKLNSANRSEIELATPCSDTAKGSIEAEATQDSHAHKSMDTAFYNSIPVSQIKASPPAIKRLTELYSIMKNTYNDSRELIYREKGLSNSHLLIVYVWFATMLRCIIPIVCDW